MWCAWCYKCGGLVTQQAYIPARTDDDREIVAYCPVCAHLAGVIDEDALDAVLERLSVAADAFVEAYLPEKREHRVVMRCVRCGTVRLEGEGIAWRGDEDVAICDECWEDE